ncbi:MAG: guanosine monophosphate reductase [Microgenomates group bacterium]
MNQNIPFALSYDDVLLVPQFSKINSRSDVDLAVQLSPRIKLSLPLTTAPMSDLTGVEMAIAIGKLGGLGFLHRFTSIEKQADMVEEVKKKKVQVGAAVGCREGYLERAEALVKAGTDILLLDVTHGHMQKAINVTSKLKNMFGKHVDIMSGLVATGEGAKNLFKAGADCVHVGIGGGSICTTRIAAGIGVPNITTILDAAKVARRLKKTIVADGGIKNSGDIVKSLAAGSSAVRAGNIFAGTNEAPGKIIKKAGKTYKSYNASTSLAEKKNHVKTIKNTGKTYLYHIEGVKSIVPYKGPVSKIIKLIDANLRAGFSYCGAKNIKELWKNAHFIRISQLGVKESGTHDVLVEKEKI